MDLASWELSGDNTTLAEASLPGYTSPFARTAHSSQGQPDIFYSSCASSQPSQLLKLSNHSTPLLWFIPDTSHYISCAHPTGGFYELTFEHIYPKQVTVHWGVLAACPHFCLCQTCAFAPALRVQGLCLLLHGSTAHHPLSSARTQPPHAQGSGTCEKASSHPENMKVLLACGISAFGGLNSRKTRGRGGGRNTAKHGY